MRLDIKTRNDRTAISVKEERLDAHNSGELKDKILRALQDGSRHVVVDLTDVKFIDSSGLGALLSGYKNASQRAGTLVLSGLQPRVLSMFELTRLNRVFEIYPRLQDVVGSQGVS